MRNVPHPFPVRPRRSARQRREGIALLVVMMVIILSTSVATYAFHTSSLEARAAGTLQKAAAAKQCAEAMAMVAMLWAEQCAPVGGGASPCPQGQPDLTRYNLPSPPSPVVAWTAAPAWWPAFGLLDDPRGLPRAANQDPVTGSKTVAVNGAITGTVLDAYTSAGLGTMDIRPFGQVGGQVSFRAAVSVYCDHAVVGDRTRGAELRQQQESSSSARNNLIVTQ